MYQALYRKYRPQTFDDVVGQLAVTQTLKNQLINNRLSHAYLFTGTRGTGKTTCAKILAKAVNCENPHDGNPCNCCSACRSIDSGACMDVLEIDAASNNGVDNVRSLRDDAIYTPAEVKKRVYIIDEVHMLSISAFNALLKIIEEPPEHLLFILATTELHKVPATILSRCQRFSFRRILPEDIVDRLNYIAYKEQIPLEADAAAYLARLADGGMRDAVSLLDQCASAASGTIDTEQVCKTLGLAGTRKTAEMMQAIGAHDSAAVLTLFNGQYAEGKDLAAMLDELCTVARDLLILKTASSGVSLISGICTEQELKTLLPLFGAGELLRMTALLRDAAAGFSASANRRIDAELCLMRLCEPEASLDAESINARLSRLENKLASGLLTVQTAPETPKPEEETPPWQEEEMPPAPEEAPPEAAEESVSDSAWPQLVQRLRTALKAPAMGMFSVSDNAPLQGRLTKDELILTIMADFAENVINKPDVLQTITEVASAQAGHPVKVRLVRKGEEKKSNGSFDRFLSFGEEHPELIEFK
ncbi:MAG: DNA polymerase III subunit gamma/tau [Oscillospiraceae bacterium]|nr:DNA polymerase III subunit gamma/tau [Oscillospiraceae bacterium]